MREPPQAQQLVLADGGLLVADLVEVDKETLVADSLLFGLVRLPLDCVAGAMLVPPSHRHPKDLLLDRIGSASGDCDLVILANGDELAGRMVSIGDDTLRLETDPVAADIELHRVRAIIFDPGLVRRPTPEAVRAIAGFGDGSRLQAKEIVLEGESLTVELAGGTALKAAAADLVCLQPLGGTVIYLSDLEPAGSRQVPYLDLSWPPCRTDRKVTGGLLRAGGRLYLKGLGVHSASRLTYELDGSYRAFRADLAIDDSTAGGGSVRFVVYVDQQPKFASQIVRGAMAPVPISVDLTGARRLDLVVDFADRADVLDHADWLNARLVRDPLSGGG
jgi:hypothetical protein